MPATFDAAGPRYPRPDRRARKTANSRERPEPMPTRPPTYAFIAGFCLFATGCGGSPANQTNFERLKVGMTSQQVEGILGKGGKEISSEEVATLLREALTPKGGSPAAGPKLELPDLSGARGVRWGDDKKSITVIYTGDRVSRIFKKGF